MANIIVSTTPFLRLALLGDAAASGVTGLLLAGAAGPLTSLLALPEPLLGIAGLFLLPYAAVVAWTGSRAKLSRHAVRAIIGVNLLWVAGSLLLLALGPALAGLAPSALGIAFVLAQALVVLGFAIVQVIALRQVGSTEIPHAFA